MMNGKLYPYLILILVSVTVLVPAETFSSAPMPSTPHTNIVNSDVHMVHVALYDCGYNNRFFDGIFEYNWTKNNHSYAFEVTVVNRDDVLGRGNISLTTENFDLLLIGASASSYLLDGLDPEWKKNVQQFVAGGGGYMGICGGANAASMGFEHPKNMFQRRVNRGVLELANVYINDYFLGSGSIS